MIEKILHTINKSLYAITQPRFYRTERGFQGELLAEIKNKLPELKLHGAIIEQEYQKRMKDHGFKIRPDLIIHIPYEDGDFENRKKGNFVVIELKLKASKKEAIDDYKNLSQMCNILKYPMAVFINIDSNQTFFDEYDGENKDKLFSFSTQLIDDEVIVTKSY